MTELTFTLAELDKAFNLIAKFPRVEVHATRKGLDLLRKMSEFNDVPKSLGVGRDVFGEATLAGVTIQEIDSIICGAEVRWIERDVESNMVIKAVMTYADGRVIVINPMGEKQ